MGCLRKIHFKLLFMADLLFTFTVACEASLPRSCAIPPAPDTLTGKTN